MFEAVTEAIQTFIHDIGYIGLFVLMVLESTFVPVPSVLVMPFAGFLATEAGGGHFSLPLVIAMNSLGALVGSSLFYVVGMKGGKPFLLRHGKWFLIKPADIEKTEQYFAKPGRLTVFIARFIPVVRHFISFVAGIGRMPFGPFMLQTFLGSTLWGGFLAVLGFVLGENWKLFTDNWKKFDVVIGVGIILVAIFLYLRWRKRRAAQAALTAEATPEA